jgi:hypothetical protein
VQGGECTQPNARARPSAPIDERLNVFRDFAVQRPQPLPQNVGENRPQAGRGRRKRLLHRNRKAKFYSISKAGRKQLIAETENWERVSGVIKRLLRISSR